MKTLARCAALALATLAVATLAFAARADAYVYWATGLFGNDAIGRANLDGTGASESFIAGASGPTGVAVDSAHVYWTNDNDTIGRANLDATGANQSFIAAPSANRRSAMAVDGAHLYWVSKFSDPDPIPGLAGAPNTGAIGRANLDGTGVNPNFITGVSYPTGVAVDAAHVYWAEGTNQYLEVFKGAIGRANLDGTGVNRSFIAASNPMGVAVDSAHVYWAEVEPVLSCPLRPSLCPPIPPTRDYFNAIGRANLDGTGVNPSFTPASPTSLAVDSAHVYWTTVSTIGRADLDGGHGTNDLIVPEILSIDTSPAVALDALGPPPSNKFRLAGAKVNKKRGPAKLTVKVAGPGELKLAKTGSVKGQRERAAQSGKLKLLVKAKGKARKRLKKRGKAKVNARVTYTPDGGASDTKSKKIKLVKR